MHGQQTVWRLKLHILHIHCTIYTIQLSRYKIILYLELYCLHHNYLISTAVELYCCLPTTALPVHTIIAGVQVHELLLEWAPPGTRDERDMGHGPRQLELQCPVTRHQGRGCRRAERRDREARLVRAAVLRDAAKAET